MPVHCLPICLPSWLELFSQTGCSSPFSWRSWTVHVLMMICNLKLEDNEMFCGGVFALSRAPRLSGPQASTAGWGSDNRSENQMPIFFCTAEGVSRAHWEGLRGGAGVLSFCKKREVSKVRPVIETSTSFSLDPLENIFLDDTTYLCALSALLRRHSASRTSMDLVVCSPYITSSSSSFCTSITSNATAISVASGLNQRSSTAQSALGDAGTSKSRSKANRRRLLLRQVQGGGEQW